MRGGAVLTGKRVVVTGGTGSFGRVITRRLLGGEVGLPEEVVVFSRSEANQHQMRLDFQHLRRATDDIVYEEERKERLKFKIGDVSNYGAVCSVLSRADVVFHAAAMKQVPTCEYHPFEAVRTNVNGAENIVRAIRELDLPVETVIAVTTDKACKPVNVMGMTKALSERIFIQAGIDSPKTRFMAVRYGNVLASRGSVIPLFHEQIRNGGPVTITTPEMTRFLLSLDQAVDTVFDALRDGRQGETHVPRVPAARITDLAAALIGDAPIELELTGIRPGEKIHEILISEEEAPRTYETERNLAILPILPELRADPVPGFPFEGREYSSGDEVVDPQRVGELLEENRLLPEHEPQFVR
jgi:FlaA1/EpsC-like NDP-sugar epimerase